MTAHITFFNNRGGVGKTSLVYHSAFMFAEKGFRVLAVDLDPQSSLSSMALDESRLEALWLDDEHALTMYGAVAPLFNGTGDVCPVHIEPLGDLLGLLVGNPALSPIEEALSTGWPRCLDGCERTFRVTTAFWRVIHEAAKRYQADVVLLDVGPNLGAINRSAFVASSHVLMPVAPDLLSLQGLKNLGPMLRKWRSAWAAALPYAPGTLGEMPLGDMSPLGYVLMQQVERFGNSARAYTKWQTQLPIAYRTSVSGEEAAESNDHQIHRLKHYRSLMPMAMEARKPMFSLTNADGAIGAYQTNVQQCHDDFSALVTAIAARTGLQKST